MMTIKEVYKKKQNKCEALIVETNEQIDIVKGHLKTLMERRDAVKEKAKKYNKLYMECSEVHKE